MKTKLSIVLGVLVLFIVADFFVLRQNEKPADEYQRAGYNFILW